VETKRIEVQSQPRQIVLETLCRKKHHKKRAGGVAQGPEFKPQDCKKKKKKKGWGCILSQKKEKKKVTICLACWRHGFDPQHHTINK
jgi:hypothetical protein